MKPQALGVAIAGGAGFALGDVLYPALFAESGGLAEWGIAKWATVFAGTGVTTGVMHLLLVPRLNLVHVPSADFTPALNGKLWSSATLSFVIVAFLAVLEQILHKVFADSYIISVWLADVAAAAIVTYGWVRGAELGRGWIAKTGLKAGLIAGLVLSIFVVPISLAHEKGYAWWYFLIAVINGSVGFGAVGAAVGFAISRRLGRHPGIDTILGFSAIVLIVHFLRSLDPRSTEYLLGVTPQAALAHNLFQVVGWGGALLLYAPARVVLYGSDAIQPVRSPMREVQKVGVGPISRFFVLKWALLSAVGWSVGYAAGEYVSSAWPLAVNFLEKFQRSPEAFKGVFEVGFQLGFALQGIGLGVAQWLYIRRVVAVSGWWIVGSASIFATHGLLSLWAFQSPAISAAAKSLVGAIGLTVAYALGAGLVGGLLQWITLRRWTPRAHWWVPASILGYLLFRGVPGPLTLLGVLLPREEMGYVKYTIASWPYFLAGLLSMCFLTGFVLVRLLRPRVSPHT